MPFLVHLCTDMMWLQFGGILERFFLIEQLWVDQAFMQIFHKWQIKGQARTSIEGKIWKPRFKRQGQAMINLDLTGWLKGMWETRRRRWEGRKEGKEGGREEAFVAFVRNSIVGSTTASVRDLYDLQGTELSLKEVTSSILRRIFSYIKEEHFQLCKTCMIYYTAGCPLSLDFFYVFSQKFP